MNNLVLWVGAFRYYLGRQTSSVHSFCDLLMFEIDNNNFDVNTLQLMKAELLEAFQTDDRDREKEREVFFLGHEVDRKKWLEVLLVLSGG